jgi:hypothetical protein
MAKLTIYNPDNLPLQYKNLLVNPSDSFIFDFQPTDIAINELQLYFYVKGSKCQRFGCLDLTKGELELLVKEGQKVLEQFPVKGTEISVQAEQDDFIEETAMATPEQIQTIIKNLEELAAKAKSKQIK